MFYEKETKVVKIVSVEQVVVRTQEVTTEFSGHVIPRCYPVIVIPSIAIATVIKTDKVYMSVIAQVQTTDITLAQVIPTSIEMQQISATITKYTMVLIKQQVSTQVVVLYDSTTQSSTVITTGIVQAHVKPYYVTTTEVEGGTIIDTNSVTEITTTHTEATAVLEYSNTYLQTSTNWTDISHIQVVPSPVIGGNIIYVIETKNTTSTQKIEISYNSVTQAMTVVTLIVKPVAEIYPSIQPLITIDTEIEHAEVSTYVEVIKTSQTTRKDIKKIVSVTKEVTSYYEKIFVEAITQTGEIEYVTLIVKPNKQPVVVSVEIIEEGEGQATEEASSEV